MTLLHVHRIADLEPRTAAVLALATFLLAPIYWHCVARAFGRK